MITLITGTPGAGKSAWTVQELTRLPAQRKIYVHGIPELKIAHEPIYCHSELCDLCQSVDPLIKEQGAHVEDWPQWATHGSLIVIDEVQRIWRPSNSASALPDSISRLETHRHMGLDFWLISQGPHLFHSNIRLLIGRHIHLVSKWNGRSEYEFPECRQDVTRRSDAVVRPYKLPKKVFGLYKSASLHTTNKKRAPLALYFFVFLVFGLSIYGYKTATSINNKSTLTTPEVSAAEGGLPSVAADNSQPTNFEKNPNFPDFTPTVPNLPESAPAYSHLIEVKAAPILMGCVMNTKQKTCKCYTQQATPYPASFDYCAEVVAGHRFNPYKTPLSSYQTVSQPPKLPPEPLQTTQDQTQGLNSKS